MLMTAYLIVDFDLHDQADLHAYAKIAVPLIAKLGGRVLVSGGEFEVIEGPWQPHRLAIIQFRDRSTARAFFDDAECKAIRERFRGTVSIAADGTDTSTDIRNILASGMP